MVWGNFQHHPSQMLSLVWSEVGGDDCPREGPEQREKIVNVQACLQKVSPALHKVWKRWWDGTCTCEWWVSLTRGGDCEGEAVDMSKSCLKGSNFFPVGHNSPLTFGLLWWTLDFPVNLYLEETTFAKLTQNYCDSSLKGNMEPDNVNSGSRKSQRERSTGTQEISWNISILSKILNYFDLFYMLNISGDLFLYYWPSCSQRFTSRIHLEMPVVSLMQYVSSYHSIYRPN